MRTGIHRQRRAAEILIACDNQQRAIRIVKRLHIIGGKNHGKTTLIVDLVRELTGRGFRIGTIKHTHHHHELDTPGKDSHRHREAGSAVVGICSRSMNAVFWPPDDKARGDERDEEMYAKLAPVFQQCDLVLVEGDSQTRAAKLEVWRGEIGTPPLAESDTSISVIVADAPHPPWSGISVWPRSDVAALANNILASDLMSS